MKCILCGKRKGKRHCPGKNSLICAKCCGEKRMIEVNCPADCTYLGSGHGHQVHRRFAHQFSENPAGAERYYETLYAFEGVVVELERTILRYASEVRALSDRDVLEAVELLKRNCQTEQKGVIFEHHSPNPLAEPLTRELTAVLDAFREGNEERRSLRLDEALNCLENILIDLRYHLEDPNRSLTYLQFIARTYPDVGTRPKESRIIQP